MSKQEIIERLGALLARVRTRSAASRTALAGRGEPLVVDAGSAAGVAAGLSSAPLQANELATGSDDVFVGGHVREAAAPAPVPTDALDGTVLRDPSDSEERLVAAEPPRDRPDGVHESTQRKRVSDSLPDALASDFDELDAAGEVEQAPISSRRPVAPDPEERLALLAFGAQEPQVPRHTPPPESGQLLAMPDVEFDGDVTGVRDSSPVSPNRSEQAVAVEVAARPLDRDLASSAPTRDLVPQVTRPQIGTSEQVMDVLGEAQAFGPPTFFALLEASLKL
ncbi:MAG: hypothetical protein M3O36_08030 [Myxococcota bacterium]|nr:hypothetical protein [Myxococcota bacterium]